MTAEEAQEEIAKKTQAALKLIREAEELADQHQVEFHLEVAYGMGGTYVPKRDKDEDWENSDSCFYDDYEEEGWISSSSQC